MRALLILAQCLAAYSFTLHAQPRQPTAAATTAAVRAPAPVAYSDYEIGQMMKKMPMPMGGYASSWAGSGTWGETAEDRRARAIALLDEQAAKQEEKDKAEGEAELARLAAKEERLRYGGNDPLNKALPFLGTRVATKKMW